MRERRVLRPSLRRSDVVLAKAFSLASVAVAEVAGWEAIKAQVFEEEETTFMGSCCFKEFPTEEVGKLIVLELIVLVERLVFFKVVILLEVIILVGEVIVLVDGVIVPL